MVYGPFVTRNNERAGTEPPPLPTEQWSASSHFAKVFAGGIQGLVDCREFFKNPSKRMKFKVVQEGGDEVLLESKDFVRRGFGLEVFDANQGDVGDRYRTYIIAYDGDRAQWTNVETLVRNEQQSRKKRPRTAAAAEQAGPSSAAAAAAAGRRVRARRERQEEEEEEEEESSEEGGTPEFAETAIIVLAHSAPVAPEEEEGVEDPHETAIIVIEDEPAPPAAAPPSAPVPPVLIGACPICHDDDDERSCIVLACSAAYCMKDGCAGGLFSAFTATLGPAGMPRCHCADCAQGREIDPSELPVDRLRLLKDHMPSDRYRRLCLTIQNATGGSTRSCPRCQSTCLVGTSAKVFVCVAPDCPNPEYGWCVKCLKGVSDPAAHAATCGEDAAGSAALAQHLAASDDAVFPCPSCHEGYAKVKKDCNHIACPRCNLRYCAACGHVFEINERGTANYVHVCAGNPGAGPSRNFDSKTRVPVENEYLKISNPVPE
jgi:hypothetical protein